MTATPAELAKAWDAITEVVAEFLKQHHPRFREVTVSVDLASGSCVLIEMQGPQGTFDEEGRDILRKFFTEDFKSKVKPQLKKYLGWSGDLRFYTNSRDRKTDHHTWHGRHIPSARRKKRRQPGTPIQFAQPFTVR